MTFNIDYETDILLNVDYKQIITDVINEAIDYADLPYEAEINVVLTSNDEIARINNEYRQIDRPTDVLSFPMLDYEVPGDFVFLDECDETDYFNPETGELMLGDIILSVEKILEQAANYGHSVERELGFLVAHSMLHLFGYDHMEDDERIVMENKQEEILDRLGLKR